MQIILASASPRRKELLHHIFNDFTIITSDCEEKTVLNTPSQYVMDLSMQKALGAHQKYLSAHTFHDSYLMIGADTIVYHNQTILGKPFSKEHACHMIRSLSAHTHKVYTGVTWMLYDSTHHILKKDQFAGCTKVCVAPMSESEIEAYISTNEPYDKAGGYGIQGIFSRYIEKIDGDYFNVVGLPVHDLYTSLSKNRVLNECILNQ